MMMVFAWGCLVILTVICLYLISAIVFANSGLDSFYINLPINRFAFRTRGGQVVGVIYNSKDYMLVECSGYPFGKFVKRLGNDAQELQKLGPIEEMLGIRSIGIPFIHGLLVKKMSWISVDGESFNERKDQPISTFAITKTFGFELKELALGRDSEKDTPAEKPKGDDQKLERILVNIKWKMQAVIEDPHLAIIATDWGAGVHGKLMRFTQSFLGHTSQDELIEQKAPVKDATSEARYCGITQEIIDNLDEIETFGVTFEPKKITYVDYELAGGTDTVTRIQAANTKRFEKGQEAAGIKAVKAAEQEDMETQRKIFLQTVTDLTEAGFSQDQALTGALSLMRAKGLSTATMDVLVEGGANVSANISATSSRGSKKKGGKS